MNLQQARNLLGVAEGETEEEIKKKYKKLAVKLHPDQNKNPDAEEKFKQVNEAYQFLIKYNNSEPVVQNVMEQGNFDFQEIFGSKWGPFANEFVNHFRPTPIVVVPVTISFEESILGCPKTIQYSRIKACSVCNGSTFKASPDNKPCAKCNGKGQIKTKPNFFISNFIPNKNQEVWVQCPECEGTCVEQIPCECEGDGTKTEEKLNVKIPPGVTNGLKLRLHAMGNFNGQQYQDAVVDIKVTPHASLSLSQDGKTVCYNTKINLLQALTGTTVKVPSVKGEKELIIPPKSLNGDVILIPGLGVGDGSQAVTIKVSYPDDVSKLIDILKG